MQNWAVSVLSSAAIVGVLVALSVIYVRMLPAAGWARSVLVSFAASLAGVLAWLGLAPVAAPGLISDLYIPIAALAALAGFIATLAVRATGAGLPVVLTFGFVWSAVVFVPAALLSFAALGPLGLEPVDHGGSLAANVATGAAALGVLLAGGAGSPRLRPGVLPLRLGVVAAVLLSVGWLAWLAGAELAVDGATPSILLNGLVGALGGTAGWLSVQRILHLQTTLSGVAAGLMSGFFSVAAGAPLFTPVSAAAAGVLAGAAACYFTLRRVAASRRQQWFIVGSHLIAGGVGIVLLGLLATDMGFLFTGQVGFIVEQIGSTVVVAAYSTAVSFLLWLALKRFVRRS